MRKTAAPMLTIFAAYDVPLLDIAPGTDPVQAFDDD